jgi:hypothetical protein
MERRRNGGEMCDMSCGIMEEKRILLFAQGTFRNEKFPCIINFLEELPCLSQLITIFA